MTKQLFQKLFNGLFCASIFIVACNGQSKTDLPKNSADTTQPTGDWRKVLHLTETDPYFIPTEVVTSAVAPRAITRHILQDKKGNIWLASWNGIICYDGKTFTNFTNKANLRRFRAFTILEDRKGNLWFGTIGAGVYRFDGQNFKNFTTQEGLVNDRVGCIMEDTKGNIWFGTSGGVSCFDGTSFRNFTTKEGLNNDDTNSLTEDKTGKIWIGNRGGACVFDGKTFTDFTNYVSFPFKNVRSIIKDKDGKIWLGGQDGLCVLDGQSVVKILEDFVGYLYEDKKGTIWMSARAADSKGMALSRHEANTAIVPFGQSNFTKIKQEESQIFAIVQDKEGSIWYGKDNGICRFDGTDFHYFRK